MKNILHTLSKRIAHENAMEYVSKLAFQGIAIFQLFKDFVLMWLGIGINTRSCGDAFSEKLAIESKFGE